MGPFILNDSVSFDMDRDITPISWKNLLYDGKGVFTSTGVTGAAFLSSSSVKKEGKGHWPDLQLMLLGAAVHDDFARQSESNFNGKPGVFQKYYEKAKGFDGFHIISILNRPKSRGEIRLRSTNPKDPPIINPNYFQVDTDIKDFIEMMKIALHLVENTTVFQSLNAHLLEVPFPGCEKHEFKSDDYLECFARHLTLTMYHPVGTCAMGKSTSKHSVVTSKLEVIGIENLRVIDASIMPTVVSANTNAACIMLGEVGADLIQEKHRVKLDQGKPDAKSKNKIYNVDTRTEL